MFTGDISTNDGTFLMLNKALIEVCVISLLSQSLSGKSGEDGGKEITSNS